MPHKILFYPVGNGDSSQIILNNGKRILFDFRHVKRTEEGEGPEINLKQRLQQELKEACRDTFDVVAFTHNDKDHIENSTDFFELRHAEKYQGAGRIKIKTLWVPAALILETATNDERGEEFVVWRQEARHRLIAGDGIRVFSKPDRLKTWLEENNLPLDARRHLITDAGELVPEFSIANDGVEFFCHSPFVKHVDEGEILSNDAALIFTVTFKEGLNTFNYMAIGDSTWEVLEDIVGITQYHNNENRLKWDIFNIPHHCSYKALSDDKGGDITVPKEKIRELLLSGREGSFMISSSDPINDTPAGKKQEQPPHIQARKCYEYYLRMVNGCKFMVTMEENKPIEMTINPDGITVNNGGYSASSRITGSPSPRAGK